MEQSVGCGSGTGHQFLFCISMFSGYRSGVFPGLPRRYPRPSSTRGRLRCRGGSGHGRWHTEGLGRRRILKTEVLREYIRRGRGQDEDPLISGNRSLTLPRPHPSGKPRVPGKCRTSVDGLRWSRRPRLKWGQSPRGRTKEGRVFIEVPKL